RPPLAKPPDPMSPTQALHLLSLLQREGRLIDFCEEDLAGFSDAQVGAAARTVHDGCRKAVREAFTLIPVRAEPEGSPVTLAAGFHSVGGSADGRAPGNGGAPAASLLHLSAAAARRARRIHRGDVRARARRSSPGPARQLFEELALPSRRGPSLAAPPGGSGR